jgi:hypothetical protein
MLVRTKLTATGITRYVADYGTQEALLDAVAESDMLHESVDEMLAYAFLHNYAAKIRNSDQDRMMTDSERFKEKLEESIAAFVQVAPFALGKVGRTGRMGGGALASTMSTYGGYYGR